MNNEPAWMTNNPAVAKKLRAADLAFDKAMAACRAFPLDAKIIAIRAAKAAKQTAYDAVWNEVTA